MFHMGKKRDFSAFRAWFSCELKIALVTYNSCAAISN